MQLDSLSLCVCSALQQMQKNGGYSRQYITTIYSFVYIQVISVDI